MTLYRPHPISPSLYSTPSLPTPVVPTVGDPLCRVRIRNRKRRGDVSVVGGVLWVQSLDHTRTRKYEFSTCVSHVPPYMMCV